ncbi:TadG family pilus assembly protein [Trinickia dinghuensis]|uniref:Pilus assembly protein TadE n=1 Tax=Trinickia dinghuensis TaxID=2291023 RepID=A0A3D8K2L1_9BURK|nr:TadG family pilus assembly protein [Trinickia dinghuensis]RDU99697.1 pilus assembly protein TadE [Trinickia dinghuensis]
MSRRALRLRRPSRRRQRGSVPLWFVLTAPILLMFGAFAVDMPRVTTVRNELQNAADAAALAGASKLIDSSSGPDWANAASETSAAVSLNASDGVTLTAGSVQTGFWNLTGTPSTLEAQTISPGLYDVPAVQVTVTRSASQNGGPVDLLLGGFLDVLSTPASATAVAVAAAPSTVDSGGLFPMVIDQCVLDQYWDAETNEPTIDPSTGLPYEFQIGNGQLYGSSCEAGQWTSFLINANDVPTVRGLIASGNPSPLSIGDDIWIEPGVKTTLYSSVPTGVTIVVPVAEQIITHSYVPIVAFAAFYVDGSYGGSQKYIEGHFVGGYRIPVQSWGVGPDYGAYVAPRLAL